MRHMYTEEEYDFLRNNISENSYSELCKKFNIEFNCNVTLSAIEHTCKRIGIHHGHPGNIFVKNENNPFSITRPIGSEMVSAGKVYVKVANHPMPSGKSRININWVQKNRYIYEQVHGKIPDGHMIVFLDSNRNNFDINNLYAIPAKINMMLGANKWFSSDRNVTLTAIKWCELFYALKQNNLLY